MRILLLVFLTVEALLASHTTPKTVLDASDWPAAVILAAGTGSVERALIAAKIRPMVSVDISEKVLDLNEKNNTINPDQNLVECDVADHQFIVDAINKQIAAVNGTQFDFLFSFLPRIHSDNSRPQRGEQDLVTTTEKDAFKTTMVLIEQFFPRIIVFEVLANTAVYVNAELKRRLPILNVQAERKTLKKYHMLYNDKIWYNDIGIPINGGRYFVVIILADDSEIKQQKLSWQEHFSEMTQNSDDESQQITIKHLWDELNYTNKNGTMWYEYGFIVSAIPDWEDEDKNIIKLPFHNMSLLLNEDFRTIISPIAPGEDLSTTKKNCNHEKPDHNCFTCQVFTACGNKKLRERRMRRLQYDTDFPARQMLNACDVRHVIHPSQDRGLTPLEVGVLWTLHDLGRFSFIHGSKRKVSAYINVFKEMTPPRLYFKLFGFFSRDKQANVEEIFSNYIMGYDQLPKLVEHEFEPTDISNWPNNFNLKKVAPQKGPIKRQRSTRAEKKTTKKRKIIPDKVVRNWQFKKTDEDTEEVTEHQKILELIYEGCPVSPMQPPINISTQKHSGKIETALKHLGVPNGTSRLLFVLAYGGLDKDSRNDLIKSALEQNWNKSPIILLEAFTEFNEKYEDNKFGEVYEKSTLNENKIALNDRVAKAFKIIKEIRDKAMSDSPETH